VNPPVARLPLALKWHVVHVGCPEIGWHPDVSHVIVGTDAPWNEEESESSHPVSCVPAGTPPAPWHRVLLKHPGLLPPGGGVGGWFPLPDSPKWQKAHSEAFPSSDVVWTYVFPGSQFAGCGELPPPRWQALFRQETCAVPPLKLPVVVPWHERQKPNPAELEGAPFAEPPCGWAAGEVATHPSGCVAPGPPT